LLAGDGGRCIDLGVGELGTPGGLRPGRPWLRILPPPPLPSTPPPAITALASKLQAQLEAGQFGHGLAGATGAAAAAGCGYAGAPAWRSVYYVNTVPLIGFGSVVEYGMLFLARATHLGSQLVLGPQSSREWTSGWACGEERSLNCYFNLTSCCGHLALRGRRVELARRRNPRSMGLSGYNDFGSAFVSAQLAHFFFGRLTPASRARLDAIRAPLHARGAEHPPTIGMHIRGGDACHARRFCPSNLTATYFAAAAELRSRYGANRLVLATDHAPAAALCAARVLGFDCRTQAMARGKFDSPTFIEHRVGGEGGGGGREGGGNGGGGGGGGSQAGGGGGEPGGGDLSGSRVALDVLADIDMLADCDFHVLILRSAVSRLVYALSLGRKGRSAPMVSMNEMWGSRALKLAQKRNKMWTAGAAARQLGRARGRRGGGTGGRRRRPEAVEPFIS